MTNSIEFAILELIKNNGKISFSQIHEKTGYHPDLIAGAVNLLKDKRLVTTEEQFIMPLNSHQSDGGCSFCKRFRQFLKDL